MNQEVRAIPEYKVLRYENLERMLSEVKAWETENGRRMKVLVSGPSEAGEVGVVAGGNAWRGNLSDETKGDSEAQTQFEVWLKEHDAIRVSAVVAREDILNVNE